MWSDSERIQLEQLLNEIIPASEDGRVPAAGAQHLGIADYLAKCGASDTPLANLLKQGLTAAAAVVDGYAQQSLASLTQAQRLATVERLQHEQAEFFQALLRHTYMAYYSRPDVRALFGLSVAPTQPDGYPVPPESSELMAILTEPVLKRGACYRDC